MKCCFKCFLSVFSFFSVGSYAFSAVSDVASGGFQIVVPCAFSVVGSDVVSSAFLVGSGVGCWFKC